ncbi:MAG: helix-turn-helix transcriptional regulator [Candidatus Accumulibacter sp.]|nr:helix-turn-helix transcriptional regulator [Accumulibacter sp.]MCB1968610.1 helix-turn-helix transcriptional regulator [Accumulibacter sp.]
MKIVNALSDEAILHELGERLAAARLERNLTQAALAEEAGVAKRTVERLESGASATQLSGFVRICRVLGLLERLDALAPENTVSPIEQLKLRGRKRQRASGRRRTPEEAKKWTWGEES